MKKVSALAARALAAFFAAACLRPLQAQELYVGANYHPHDSNPAAWRRDIRLMKDAGFRVVRMGHLAWDSYEPTDGRFDFAWFDQVMDMMDQAGIKVILDVAVRPAPLWLHHEHPSVGVADGNGILQYPNHRYMEDVGDPTYRRYALRFAAALARHYANHPALLAYGIDNEPGDGPISYSEAVRRRFIAWLRSKYTTTESLNKAWASQRWSRRIGDFDEIGLPVSGSGAANGPPERILDFRRFVSDEVNQFLFKIVATVRANAPNRLTTGNIWYYSPMKYFDYSEAAYAGEIDRGGCGIYPGTSLAGNEGLYNALFGISRIQFENTTPFWCTEFMSDVAAPGSVRKAAYASLMMGNQLVCGWTWQSMHGGEEQYLQGLVDWDGVPNRKYGEYRQIASEFRKIEKYGFPYRARPEVALAFSFPSQVVSSAFPEQHDGQLQTCFNLFLKRNIDTRVVEISRSDLKYKLLIVPGVTLMDRPTADRIREFVRRGGTVLMTGYSAMVDEHGQVFSTTHPGLLSDVFGIRVGSFEVTGVLNELSRDGMTGDRLRIGYKDLSLSCEAPRVDVIESSGAGVLGTVTSLDRDYPIVTSNRYGEGTAIYVGLPAREEILGPIVDDLLGSLSISAGPRVPAGVMARNIDSRHVLYLNLDGRSKSIQLEGKARSILKDSDYTQEFELGPYQPDFVETK
jgi:beta-galactosidase